MTWKVFDGHYDKTMYDIRLVSGEIVEECWPNAGTFYCLETGKEYDGSLIMLVKESESKY